MSDHQAILPLFPQTVQPQLRLRSILETQWAAPFSWSLVVAFILWPHVRRHSWFFVNFQEHGTKIDA